MRKVVTFCSSTDPGLISPVKSLQSPINGQGDSSSQVCDHEIKGRKAVSLGWKGEVSDLWLFLSQSQCVTVLHYSGFKSFKKQTKQVIDGVKIHCKQNYPVEENPNTEVTARKSIDQVFFFLKNILFIC